MLVVCPARGCRRILHTFPILVGRSRILHVVLGSHCHPHAHTHPLFAVGAFEHSDNEYSTGPLEAGAPSNLSQCVSWLYASISLAMRVSTTVLEFEFFYFLFFSFKEGTMRFLL